MNEAGDSADHFTTARHATVNRKTWGGLLVSELTAKPIALPGRERIVTVSILSVRTHDGLTLWQGRFLDYAHACRFWHAMNTGNVTPDIWHMPFPAWPAGLNDVLPGLWFAFDQQSYITTTNASNQTFNVPGTYNSASNQWEVVGGGASGGVSGGTTTRKASGGGSGGYSIALNVVLTPSGTALFNIQVRAAGAASSVGANGNNGSPAWFNGSTQPASSVAANGGGQGLFGTVAAVSGGVGASTTGAIGTATAGSRGGNMITGTGNKVATGGGGAPGPNGLGSNGGDTSSANTQTLGGSGDNGFGGGAGPVGGSPGNDGVEFQDGVHGCGGGSGGNDAGASGDAGKYGAASGGGAFTSATTSGNAAQAIIVGSWNLALVVYKAQRRFLIR